MPMAALHRLLLPCCLILAAFASTTAAIDVSWIPADPNGPLPLSKNYRNALAKLCALEKLPPSVPASKRQTVKQLCRKLRASESSDVSFISEHGFKVIVFLIALAAIPQQWYQNVSGMWHRMRRGMLPRRSIGQRRAGGHEERTMGRREHMRLARLRKLGGGE